MPIDKTSAETERKGVRRVADIVEEMHFIWRDMSQPDRGIDGQIELKLGDTPTAQFIMVQVKTGKSYQRNVKSESFDFYTTPNHLTYWAGCPNPVILVIHEPKSKLTYWKHIQSYVHSYPETITTPPHKVTFCKSNDLFNIKCADALSSLFGPNIDELKEAFCKHVIDKHSKLTLYSVTSDRPLAVELERVFVKLMAKKKERYFDTTIQSATQLEHKQNIYSGQFELFEAHPDEPMPEIETSGEREVIIGINEALRECRALVIVGEPGAGKTTMLKYIALAFARNMAKERLDLDEVCIPILVPLRDFNIYINHALERAELDHLGPALLPKFIHKFFSDHAPHLKFPKEFFAYLLESGRCALLLDGLDEVADPLHRVRMAETVASIVIAPSYRRNRFLLTSRPRGYEGEAKARLVTHCSECLIRPFDDMDMKEFANAWYRAVTIDLIGDTLEACIDADKRAASLTHAIQAAPQVALLARNPLLLSVLAMVHQRNIELPRLRARLYEECTNFLLGYWDERKDHESASELARLGGLNRDEKRSLLEPIALWMHERGDEGKEVERAELEKQIVLHFSEDTSDRRKVKQQAAQFLKIIEERSGLLVERAPGVYAFAHLTFQEYLAARAVADRDDYIDYILQHLHDPWWREVILLTGSIKSDTRYGKKTALRCTKAFLDAISNADSWLENILHRDQILALRCIGDMEIAGVEVAICRSLTERGIELWKDSSWNRQKSDVVGAFVNATATPHGDQFVSVLFQMLQDKDDGLRNSAVEAFCDLGSGVATATVLDHFLKLSKHIDEGVRRSVVTSLGRLGNAAATQAVLNRLLELSHKPNADLRYAVVEALGRLGRGTAADLVSERLHQLRDDKSSAVRGLVEAFFGDFNQDGRRVAWYGQLSDSGQDDNCLVSDSVVDKLLDQECKIVTAVFLTRLLDLDRKKNASEFNIVLDMLGRMELPNDSIIEDSLVSFLRAQLFNDDSFISAKGFEMVGDFAYGQLQRIAEKRARVSVGE